MEVGDLVVNKTNGAVGKVEEHDGELKVNVNSFLFDDFDDFIVVKPYDSTEDTLLHIKQVKANLDFFSQLLFIRGLVHDQSKLGPVEKDGFDTFTPILKHLTYGSEGYKNVLTLLGPSLDHHYKNNDHHPEYFKNGIDDMDLVQIVEMFCDWVAAVKRHNDGDLRKSIDINEKRFNMSPQLAQIFKNTIKHYE